MNLRALPLIAALLVAPALFAQEGPGFGLQVGVDLPQNDLNSAIAGKPGFNIGVHATFDLWSGHLLRPRLDYTWYTELTDRAVEASSTKYSNLTLGGDYLYFLAGQPRGLYVTGGISLVQWKVEYRETFQYTRYTSTKTTQNLGLAAGVGFQFNQTVGTEVRYLKSKASVGNLDAIQAGATFRF